MILTALIEHLIGKYASQQIIISALDSTIMIHMKSGSRQALMLNIRIINNYLILANYSIGKSTSIDLNIRHDFLTEVDKQMDIISRYAIGTIV